MPNKKDARFIWVKPSCVVFADRSKPVLLLCIIFVVYVSCFLCCAVLSASCSLVVTFWKIADLLALLCVVSSWVCVTITYVS